MTVPYVNQGLRFSLGKADLLGSSQGLLVPIQSGLHAPSVLLKIGDREEGLDLSSAVSSSLPGGEGLLHKCERL
jgi:hypothetical protein